eukprot:3654242-Amphidinium_carterae.1
MLAGQRTGSTETPSGSPAKNIQRHQRNAEKLSHPPRQQNSRRVPAVVPKEVLMALLEPFILPPSEKHVWRSGDPVVKYMDECLGPRGVLHTTKHQDDCDGDGELGPAAWWTGPPGNLRRSTAQSSRRGG